MNKNHFFLLLALMLFSVLSCSVESFKKTSSTDLAVSALTKLLQNPLTDRSSNMAASTEILVKNKITDLNDERIQSLLVKIANIGFIKKKLSDNLRAAEPCSGTIVSNWISWDPTTGGAVTFVYDDGSMSQYVYDKNFNLVWSGCVPRDAYTY